MSLKHFDVERKTIQRLKIVYEFDRKDELIKALDDEFGGMYNYRVTRSGPQVIDFPECHPTNHEMHIEVLL